MFLVTSVLHVGSKQEVLFPRTCCLDFMKCSALIIRSFMKHRLLWLLPACTGCYNWWVKVGSHKSSNSREIILLWIWYCQVKTVCYKKNELFALFKLLFLDCNSKVISSDCKADTLYAQNNMILTYSYICWSLSVLNWNFRNCLAVSFLASLIWPSNEKNTPLHHKCVFITLKSFHGLQRFYNLHFFNVVFLHIHFKFKYLCY